MVKEIKLTNSDKVVSVSDEDYKELSKYKWFADKNGYARRTKRVDEPESWPPQIIMHRYILGISESIRSGGAIFSWRVCMFKFPGYCRRYN